MSHDPTANNAPACKHFAHGLCTNQDCRYFHIKHDDDAPYCYAFNNSGWCDRGRECPDRHEPRPEGAPYGTVTNPHVNTLAASTPDDTQDVDLDQLALMLDEDDGKQEDPGSDSDESVEEILRLDDDVDDGAFVDGDDFVKF